MARAHPTNHQAHLTSLSVRALDGLSISSATISAETILLQIVHRQLELHASRIESPIFHCPRLQLLESAPAIGRIRTREGLESLFKEIALFATRSPECAKLTSIILPYLLHLRGVTDKRHLIDLALKNPSPSVRKKLAFGVLRSGKTREELFKVLTRPRSRKLTALGDKELTDMVAKVEVLRSLEHVSLPRPMWEEKFKINSPENRKTVRARIRTLGQAARHALDKLSELDHLVYAKRKSVKNGSARATVARPLQDARVSIAALVKGIERIESRALKPYRNLRSFLNSNHRRLLLESKEGIRVYQCRTLHEKDLWTPKRVKNFLTALHQIPEGARILTPKIRGFALTKLSHFGERRISGRVALGVPAVLSTRTAALYEGASNLTMTTLHEIGHSIQMGAHGAYVSWCQQTGALLEPNNPLIQMNSFMRLSGWLILGPVHKRELVDGNAFNFNGSLYPLARPIVVPASMLPSTFEHSGASRWVILRHHDDFLYCHNADAQFSISDNAVKDPFEDWAETFSEYLLCPERLINAAPEKFLFMEIHFHVHRSAKNYRLLSSANTALKRKATSSTLGSPTIGDSAGAPPSA